MSFCRGRFNFSICSPEAGIIVFRSLQKSLPILEHYYDEIAKIGPGVTQLIIHCGHDNEELRAITDSSLRRNQDRMIFTDQAMRDFLNSQKIKLVSWKQFRKLDSLSPK